MGRPFVLSLINSGVVANNVVLIVFHLKEREMHFAVHSLLGELWQVAEVISFRMLHDDECARLYHLAREDELGQLRQLWQVIGRVGEDKVELACARAYKLEDVALNLNKILLFEQSLDLADKVVLCGRFFNACHAGTASREELKADGARP